MKNSKKKRCTSIHNSTKRMAVLYCMCHSRTQSTIAICVRKQNNEINIQRNIYTFQYRKGLQLAAEFITKDISMFYFFSLFFFFLLYTYLCWKHDMSVWKNVKTARLNKTEMSIRAIRTLNSQFNRNLVSLASLHRNFYQTFRIFNNCSFFLFFFEDDCLKIGNIQVSFLFS